VHKGVLLRSAGGASFIAPNPRVAAERLPLDDDPDVQEAISRLEGEASQVAAFQRALERAQPPMTASVVTSTGPLPASAAAAGSYLTASTAATSVMPMNTQPLAASTSSPTVSMLSTSPAIHSAPASSPSADDWTYSPLPGGGSLVRIFFAAGSRAIVRPDDGLARLEQEARTADDIRVTGYTDSTGSLATNTALSQARAHAIRTLLMARGIAPERIAVAGLPASNYLADNVTERGRALNRRVEVQMLRRSAR
jgi:hypothetical protein